MIRPSRAVRCSSDRCSKEITINFFPAILLSYIYLQLISIRCSNNSNCFNRPGRSQCIMRVIESRNDCFNQRTRYDIRTLLRVDPMFIGSNSSFIVHCEFLLIVLYLSYDVSDVPGSVYRSSHRNTGKWQLTDARCQRVSSDTCRRAGTGARRTGL